MIWWQAEKKWGTPPGLEIILETNDSRDPEKMFSGRNSCFIYTGEFPKNARDEKIPNILERLGFKGRPLDIERFILYMGFVSETINLGDIATGKIKSLIDCLYPAIGGSSGCPEDWRIDMIYVRKGIKHLEGNTVEVSLWEKIGDNA